MGGTRSTKILGALAALALTASLTGCGDDDDETAVDETIVDDTADDTATTAGGDEQAAGGDAFCSALVEFNTAVFSAEVPDDATEEQAREVGAELKPLFDVVAENAPDDLQASADELRSTVDALAEGDATDFNSDETFETYTSFVSDVVAGCDFEAVSVTAVDYDFEGLPETVPSGTVAFELTNEGEEEHEFIVFKKADGETRSAEELLNDPAAQEEGPGEFVTATFAPPGESGSTLTDLEPGDYVVACFVPFGGAEDGPPHFTQGMFAEFTVE